MKFRFATAADTQLIFDWANDPEARRNSYNQSAIPYETHVAWFNKRLAGGRTWFYIFTDDAQEPVGQVRIELPDENKPQEALLSVSVDSRQRGKGYAPEILQTAAKDFVTRHAGSHILAYVFQENIASYKSFIKAGFSLLREETVQGIPSYLFTYSL